MKRDCSTCICKEGSCYPSTTIFDKDKTCKSYEPDYEGYIAELEKENAELKNKLEHRNCLDCSNHSSKLRMKTLELEKENAELKHTIATLRQEKDNVSMHAKAMEVVAKTRSDELTKAKEIIRSLYFVIQDRIDYKGNIPLEDEMYRARQFLKG